MKTLLALFVAFATLLIAAPSAEAQTTRFRFHLDSGARPNSDSRNLWFYQQTRQRFNHPEVQAHLESRINHNTNSSFTEKGVDTYGSLEWQLSLGRQRHESAWMGGREVVRTCRSVTVRFEIKYRNLDTRYRYVERTRRTSVRGILCSPDGGRSWYQQEGFRVS